MTASPEQLLGRTLTALTVAARALGQPFEVVVVDDASTDRTAAIARSMASAGAVSFKWRSMSTPESITAIGLT